MKDFNIICNNYKEAKFIEKYFLDKGYNWYHWYHIDDFSRERDFNNYPILIWNIKRYTDKLEINWGALNEIVLEGTEIIIEAKYLMRKEKLKKIQ